MTVNEDFFRKNKIDIDRARIILQDFDRDENGNIIIKDGTFVISKSSVKNYGFSTSWIFLSQPRSLGRDRIYGQMALIKSYISDKCPKYYTGIDAEITMANNFILPEIAKQFGLETADYYNVFFEDGKELNSEDNNVTIGRCKRKKIKPDQRYLLTPSFLREDEELLHLADIFDSPHELRVSRMIEQIENYLRIRKIPEEDIINVRRQFIKQSIFNKFIDFSDEHNLNSGIIIKAVNKKEGITERRARLTPCYDLDFAAGVYNMANGGIQPRMFFRKSDNEKSDLISMLYQFKGDFEKEYLSSIIPKIDITDAIEKGEKYGNFKLSEKAKKKYEKFFGTPMKELKDFYEQYYEEPEK